ncbi:UNVERIFIED_CONTAM: hypothetical protein FKN15_036192 [Acipenser sinensis]
MRSIQRDNVDPGAPYIIHVPYLNVNASPQFQTTPDTRSPPPYSEVTLKPHLFPFPEDTPPPYSTIDLPPTLNVEHWASVQQ